MKQKLINIKDSVTNFLTSEELWICIMIFFFYWLFLMVVNSGRPVRPVSNYQQDDGVTCVREDIHGYVCN